MENKLTNWYDKLDHYLLINHTAIWSTRLHWALLWGMAGIVLIALLTLLVPDVDYTFQFIISFFALIGFILWVRKLLQFNYFKQHAKVDVMYYPIQFFCYLITVGMLALWTYTPGIIKNIRISNSEVIEDINRMNILFCELEKDNLKKNDNNATHNSKYRIYYSWSLDDDIMSGTELYEKYILPDTKITNKEEKEKELNKLIKKYAGTGMRAQNDYAVGAEQQDEYNQYEIYEIYNVSSVNAGIQDIVGYRNNSISSQFGQGFLFFTVYYCFHVALFIFVYRHCTRKIFFWTLIGSAILLFFTMIILILMRGTPGSIYFLYMLYFAVFCLLAVSLFSKSRSDTVSLLSLNYFTFMLPTVVLYSYTYFQLDSFGNDDFFNFSFITYISYFVFIILGLPFLIGPLYKRAFTMPEK